MAGDDGLERDPLRFNQIENAFSDSSDDTPALVAFHGGCCAQGAPSGAVKTILA
jgi:hypothetical protein